MPFRGGGSGGGGGQPGPPGPPGTNGTASIPLWTDVNHDAEDLVLRQAGAVLNIYRANGAITAGAGFVVGTSGATWTLLVDNSGGTAGLTANRIPLVDTPGQPFAVSGIRRLSNGNLLMPGDTGFESQSIQLGDVLTIHEAGRQLRLSSPQFPATRFDVVAAPSVTTAASSKPRQFRLTEAENALALQSVDETTITVNPLAITRTATIARQVNAIRFRADQPMANVRITFAYATGGQEVLKYLPSKAAVLDSSNGLFFGSGDNTVRFDDSPFILEVGDQVTMAVAADNVSLRGDSDGAAHYTELVQRGSYSDLAYDADIITSAERTKLTGIADNADVSPTTEAIQDIVGAMVGTNSIQSGITVSYNDAAAVLNFVAGASVASFTSFSADGQALEVHPGTVISGSLVFRWAIENLAQVVGNLTIAQDGTNLSAGVNRDDNSVSLAVTTTTLTNAGDSTTFTISGLTTQTVAFSRSFTVRASATSEFFYYGLSGSNNAATIDITTMNQHLVETGEFSFSLGPTTLNQYIILLAPQDHDLTSLVNTGLGQNVLASYTETASVRTINGQLYDAYVLGPLNAGFTVSYRGTFA